MLEVVAQAVINGLLGSSGIATLKFPGALTPVAATIVSASPLPLASQATGTTLKPHIAALAGLVPCALVGIRQTLRCASPRISW